MLFTSNFGTRFNSANLMHTPAIMGRNSSLRCMPQSSISIHFSSHFATFSFRRSSSCSFRHFFNNCNIVIPNGFQEPSSATHTPRGCCYTHSPLICFLFHEWPQLFCLSSSSCCCSSKNVGNIFGCYVLSMFVEVYYMMFNALQCNKRLECDMPDKTVRESSVEGTLSTGAM